MSHWQATFTSVTGQVMSLGLEAPDETSAFQRALAKVPFTPDTFSLTEIRPLCAEHRVRHHCQPVPGKLRVYLEFLFEPLPVKLLASNME